MSREDDKGKNEIYTVYYFAVIAQVLFLPLKYIDVLRFMCLIGDYDHFDRYRFHEPSWVKKLHCQMFTEIYRILIKVWMMCLCCIVFWVLYS